MAIYLFTQLSDLNQNESVEDFR